MKQGQEKTPMMKLYMVKLLIRILLFLITGSIYLWDKEMISKLMHIPVWQEINFMHILWLTFMLMMVQHLFPKEKMTMALLKIEEKKYEPVDGYSKEALQTVVKEQNKRAWMVMLVWIMFNSIFGILYGMKILDNSDMLMLTVFYFLCDYICILFFCPFQTFIMKNKCCVNCRIYDWGHFMMFTPMLFIGNFYSVSLFLMSCIVLIHWEVRYIKHPERFWQGSNARLKCENCRDKTCRIKKVCTAKIVKR